MYYPGYVGSDSNSWSDSVPDIYVMYVAKFTETLSFCAAQCIPSIRVSFSNVLWFAAFVLYCIYETQEFPIGDLSPNPQWWFLDTNIEVKHPLPI